MLRWSLSDSAGHFWQPSELENMANPDFENLKHLQNPGHLSLTKASITHIKLYNNYNNLRKHGLKNFG